MDYSDFTQPKTVPTPTAGDLAYTFLRVLDVHEGDTVKRLAAFRRSAYDLSDKPDLTKTFGRTLDEVERSIDVFTGSKVIKNDYRLRQLEELHKARRALNA